MNRTGTQTRSGTFSTPCTVAIRLPVMWSQGTTRKFPLRHIVWPLLLIVPVLLMGPQIAPASQPVPVVEAVPPSVGPFSFVVWGHPRGNTSGEPALHLDEILSRLAELRPDFVVLTGDVIHGMVGREPDPDVIRADWESFDTSVGALGIPFYRLPGNHDVSNEVTKAIFLERYPNVPFAFTFKGNRFILLDSVGINRQYDPAETTWRTGVTSLDETNLEFLRKEIANQDNYSHIFIFMHHPQPWARSTGSWWDDVHPLLRGGRTRGVFAGSPWQVKYGHMEKDGIHYILSSTLPLPDVRHLNTFPDPAKWAIFRELDNMQFVRVDGDRYSIQTLVVGALDSPGLNWAFWEQIQKPPSQWRERLMVRFHMMFPSLTRLVLITTIVTGICFAAGVTTATIWRKFRSRTDRS